MVVVFCLREVDLQTPDRLESSAADIASWLFFLNGKVELSVKAEDRI